MTIKFGTSGWRAIIADEFTFANVTRVTKAICGFLGETGGSRRLALGHDTRFMGEAFAETSAHVAVSRGFAVLRCAAPVPTPAFSHLIRTTGADGGINFTASHNPPQYNGMKFSTADGAPALPEATRRVEQLIAAGDDATSEVAATGEQQAVDPLPAYFDDLRSKVRFDVIANAGGSYAYDPLWGTGRGYLDRILREHGLEVHTIHDWRDVTFGGRSPEPDATHLDELRATVSAHGCRLGLATDGDADRFGLLDRDGTFITPNELIAILFDYLAESRGAIGLGVARSVATSHLVDRVAQARRLPVYETPVGFKYIGQLINEDRIVIGGEESAGLSIRNHYPEKDGILACLLAAEACAARNASLTEQLADVYARVGRLYSDRIGVRLTPEIAAVLPDKLRRDPTDFAGRAVTSVNRTDGVKYSFADGAWLLLRPSGTEPLVRIYAESPSQNDLEVLLEQGRKFLLG